MDGRINCYRVLAACEADPDYSNATPMTDVCGHAVALMGLQAWPPFARVREFLGLDWMQGDELWWMCHEGNDKECTLDEFARFIFRIHGPGPDGVPARMRLL